MKKLIEDIDMRFTSGNSIPVHDARINHEEWALIKCALIWIEEKGNHGVAFEHEDGTLEFCRAGQFTRSLEPDGSAEVYDCTCGLTGILG